jgi:glycosyltransferase involved in cell wall biosynthesis
MTPLPKADQRHAKPRVVLSGVNLRDMGPLAVFRDALKSLAAEYGEHFEIVALIHRRSLFDVEGVTYVEYPEVASSWLARLRFEYWSCKKISQRLKPKVWLSMHDITPNVRADVRAVYCHNPAPFYHPRRAEFLADPTILLFSTMYRFLYRINIHANNLVIVQQEWMREQFEHRYEVRNVVVAHPSVEIPKPTCTVPQTAGQHPFRFFYPAAPRTFKNPEVCLKAARILEQRGFTNFELWLTFDGSTNRYAANVVRQFADMKSVRWLGTLGREQVFELYEEADCLLFPSRLETWGLPMTEFRQFGKPMLVADEPYARETAAGHELVKFFGVDDANALAELMMQTANGQSIFSKAPDTVIQEPYARNWAELWKMLLGPA